LFATFETIYKNVIFSAYTPWIREESKFSLREEEEAHEISRGDQNTGLRWPNST